MVRGVSEGAPVKVHAAFGSVVNRFEFETGTSRTSRIFSDSHTYKHTYNVQIGTKSKP